MVRQFCNVDDKNRLDFAIDTPFAHAEVIASSYSAINRLLRQSVPAENESWDPLMNLHAPSRTDHLAPNSIILEGKRNLISDYGVRR